MTLARTRAAGDGTLPTATNVDHVAVTVPDLGAAARMFSEAFGGRWLYQQGPVRDEHGDSMAVELGVHPRASCDVALMRLGPSMNLELFEYRAPGQRHVVPQPTGPGGHLIALAVASLADAAGQLARRGDLVPDGRAFTVPAGPFAGDRVQACRTAWGLPILLVEPTRSGASGLYAPLGPEATAPSGALGLLGLRFLWFAVPDLEQAVQFVTGHLGGRLVGDAHPRLARLGHAWRAGDRPAAAVLRLGPVTNVVLAQAEPASLAGRDEAPANSDIGGHHLAIHVRDVDAAYAHLRSVAGVTVLGEPRTIAEHGPIDGDRWIYFRTPWGMQMEILSLPEHLPYERLTTARRYGPATSWAADGAA
jgi:catechol 2,3-dioxygenase-like lactoylglutathione lyase family enzyme